jgi:N-acyl-D-amino-acid deacylase
MDDLVIRGGTLLDGTGAEPVRADPTVRDGRIAAITPRHSGPARRVVEADGLVVAPGFIDIKTHSDFTLPYAPRAESKILQGVTTEVVGHCGFSLAPVVPGRARLLQESLAGFAPWGGGRPRSSGCSSRILCSGGGVSRAATATPSRCCRACSRATANLYLVTGHCTTGLEDRICRLGRLAE